MKDGFPSEPVSSVSAGGNVVPGKSATDQSVSSEQGPYYPPTSCYDYYYPGKVFISIRNLEQFISSSLRPPLVVHFGSGTG